MESTKVGFVVFAYEDTDRAANTLRSIASQEIDAPFDATLILVHDCDSFTLDTVRVLTQDKISDIQLIRVQFKEFDLPVKKTIALAGLSNNIPEDLDWVWLLEDSTSLHTKESFKKVHNKIHQSIDEKVNVIHACEAVRALDTDTIEIGTVEDVCEIHGYFEVLGDLSTLIIRRTEFNKAFGKHFQDIIENLKTTESEKANFVHAQLIFLSMRESDIAIFDNRLVRRKDNFLLEDGQIDLERVVSMMEQICELSDAINPGTRWQPDFFRVRDTNLCLKLLTLNGEVLKDLRSDALMSTKIAKLTVGWQGMLRLIDHIDDDRHQVAFTDAITAATGLLIDVIDQKPGSAEKLKSMFLANEPQAGKVYPSTLFNTPYQLTA